MAHLSWQNAIWLALSRTSLDAAARQSCPGRLIRLVVEVVWSSILAVFEQVTHSYANRSTRKTMTLGSNTGLSFLRAPILGLAPNETKRKTTHFGRSPYVLAHTHMEAEPPKMATWGFWSAAHMRKKQAPWCKPRPSPGTLVCGCCLGCSNQRLPDLAQIVDRHLWHIFLLHVCQVSHYQNLVLAGRKLLHLCLVTVP